MYFPIHCEHAADEKIGYCSMAQQLLVPNSGRTTVS